MRSAAVLLGACLSVSLFPLSVAAEREGDDLVATRATGPVDVDGRLDERAWTTARPFRAFVEIHPHEGAAPGERTEVRVLYDDDRLYVGIVCYDSEPERISRAMGRRDHVPPSDTVAVAIDSAHDHRTGYYFILNAAGVQEDRLLHDDTGETDEWDAIWDGAAAPIPGGWSAELAIPLRVLRFDEAGPQRWGLYVQRKIARTHAVVASTLIPLGAGAFVSRFGHLATGSIAPRRGLELAPFVAARITARPRLSDAARPRITDPSGDLGLDFRFPLSHGVGVTGTVNPDFGQVEADPVILNLTRFEPFFPEKRPFFVDGMDLFQPVGGESGSVPHQILYSRRIGLDAPILAAAKVGGDLAPGVQIGLVDAFVAGASAPAPNGTGPDRRTALHWEQPFHLAPNDALPAIGPAPANFLAATIRRATPGGSFVGLTGALAMPMVSRCTDADLARDAPPGSCDTSGGNAAGFQWDVRSRESEYQFTGQLAASQVVGGPPVRVLGDGTALRRGDAGVGAYATAGKTGGEPWRLWVSYEFATPRLDLNATGYQPDQNQHAVRPGIEFVREGGFGPLHRFSASVSVPAAWSADGAALRRRAGIRSSVSATLPGFNDVSCDVGGELPAWDLREIYGFGIPYRRPFSLDGGCSVATDAHRPLAFSLGARFLRIAPEAQLPSARGWEVSASAVLRPEPRLETRLGVDVTGEPVPARFLEEDAGTLFFGDLAARSLSLTLRQQVVATPRLSFIGYLQLFTSNGRYSSFYAAPAASRIEPSALSAVEPPPVSPDFRSVSLRLNAVVRWEYRAGSTLYLVYSRSQEGDAVPPGGPPGTLLPTGLGVAPATDVVLLKWSHWLST